MKKILTILLVSILVFSGLGTAALSKEKKELQKNETINFSEPITLDQENYIQIKLDQTSEKLLKTGKPILPKLTKVYTFPFGTKITDVKVTFSESYEKQVSKPIIPAPEPQIISTTYISKPVSEPDPLNIYSNLEIYPEKRFSYRAGAGLKNGEHVVFLSIQVYPIQYIPKTNTIQYSKIAEIEISFDTPDNSLNFPDIYDLLIITPTQFTSQLQPLVDYKNNDSIKTKIVTLDDIPNNGVDEQESIKLYIKEAIENWGITYLLLVGAGLVDNELFPVRYAWLPSGHYEEKFPSDLYYADIYNETGAFSDWDADEDGRYAEEKIDMSEVDMYPDVYLGKLPCNNENEVKVIVDKIINYEEHNKMLNKILQIGGDTFPGDPQEVNEGEFANTEVLKKLPGYTSIKVWASQTSGAQALTKKNIANGYVSGVDFVDFSGHGSWGSWATHATQEEKTWLPPQTLISPYTGWLYIDYDMYNINNEFKHPVVVFNACSCSKYSESNNCIAWKSIRDPGGGIASFGASGIGYGSYGYYEVERVWGWMEVHIFENIYNDKILGEAWAESLNGYINSFIDDEWDPSDYKTVLEGVKNVINDRQKGFYLVAEENKGIIGQMMITYEWSDWQNKNIWWFQSVYINKSWRKKGVFKQLFKTIKERALENNVDTLRLYVHSNNIEAKQVYHQVKLIKKSYDFYQITLQH